MLITQQHLRDQERYVEELVRWHSLQVADNYGLVRKSFSGKPALSLNLSVRGGRLAVEVVRCQALMPDGHYVEINESSYGGAQAEAQVSDGAVPVYISIDAVGKKQVGDPDPSEEVPRVPYICHDCAVHIGKKPSVPEGQYIQIASLKVSGGEVTPAAEYYPPCMTLFSDEGLDKKVHDYKNRLDTLITLASQAYMAISADTTLASQKTSLQAAFKDTIGHFVHHLASSFDQLVPGRNASHPLSLVVYFKRLFRVFSTLLNLHGGLRDYVNEKYFMKVGQSDIERYMKSIDSFLMAPYNHNDLGGHLASIDSLLSTLRAILGFFAEVKKDQLADQAMATESLTYRGITFQLADYSSSKVEKVGDLHYLVVEIAKPAPMSDLVILMAKDLFETRIWSNMQVRLGLNEARGLGETDPISIDAGTFANKVSLHAQDMVKSSQVKQVTLIFRGAGDAEKLSSLGKSDLIIYKL